MQAVEIAKALGQEARLVIMDEPTAALSDREAESLFAAIRLLKQRGVAIVYITHKMDEVFAIADTVTVLRDGRHIVTRPAADLDADTLIRLMVGRDLREIPQAARRQGSRTFRPRPDPRRRLQEYQLRSLPWRGAGACRPVGCRPHGNRAGPLRPAPADSGKILVEGRTAGIRRPADAMRWGIGMVSEDRKGQGIVPAMSVKHNLTLAALADFCRGPFIRRRYESAVAEENIRSLAIRASGSSQAVGELSGGNQQKVVIAKTCSPARRSSSSMNRRGGSTSAPRWRFTRSSPAWRRRPIGHPDLFGIA